MSLFRRLANWWTNRRARNDNGQRMLPATSPWNGRLAPPPQTVTRWYLADLEHAILLADRGDLKCAAQLCRSLRRDGVLSGVLSTRTGGLVRLPRRFSGAADQVAELQGQGEKRGIFRVMVPDAEAAKLAADGILLGVGVGEMVEVEGLPFKVLRRLDPEHLRYRWHEDAWYYNAVGGPIRITPGDGRWVLHCPGGTDQPWVNGLWASLGRSYIAKEHAFLHRENYSAKLANAARAAVAPQGATESQRRGFLQRLIAWGVNTVFELPPGWDVKLIESNGRGYEVFADTIKKSDEEFIIAIAGQLVTVSGGTGFSNQDVHKSIRADLIQETADALAATINEQVLLPWVNEQFGGGALETAAEVAWDTSPPKDQKAEAEARSAVARSIDDLNVALHPYGLRADITETCSRFGIQTEAIPLAKHSTPRPEAPPAEPAPLEAAA